MMSQPEDVNRDVEKPVVLLSIPRSGSSWLGSILSECCDVEYAREPVTSVYMEKCAPCVSFFDFSACKDPGLYYSQWKEVLREKTNSEEQPGKKVLIKEVNPFVIQWLAKEFDVRILYLVRHPAAVANSFYAKGWKPDHFVDRFSSERIKELQGSYQFNLKGDFWETFGALQAVQHHLFMDALQKQNDFLVVRYEDLCAAPDSEFERVVRFCGFKWDDAVVGAIRSSSRVSMETYVPGEYTLTRSSSQMVEKWKEYLSEESLTKLRKWYLANRPPFYSERGSW
jgi:hypothetical protein